MENETWLDRFEEDILGAIFDVVDFFTGWFYLGGCDCGIEEDEFEIE